MHHARLVTILVFTLCLSSFCRAQIVEPQAKALAETEVRRYLNLTDSTPLRLHRREDLEDDLFGFQIKIRGKIARAAYFYEVTDSGFYVVTPEEAGAIISDHGDRKWLIAVSAKTGQTYGLYGFKDAMTFFNRLAKDALLRVDRDTEARLYSYFFFTVVEDLAEKRVVFNERHLRHEVEDYYFEWYPEGKANTLYKKWWRGFSNQKQDYKFGADAQKNSDGFSSTLTTITGKDKSLQFQLWHLLISPTGVLRNNSVQDIYP
jgi:hypothetical protein